MKSVEIICCLFIVIFALAVAHPLPDNVLEQVEAKPNGGSILAQESVQTQVLPSLKLDPSGPSLLLKDPTEAALILKVPSGSAFLLKDPTAPSYLQKLPADDNAAASDMSQDDLQEQQDPEAIMYSEEALDAIFNDTPQERELQTEE